MTPEQIRALAIECGFNEQEFMGKVSFRASAKHIIAYTAAVEAIARESIRVEMLTVEECNDMQSMAFRAGVESVSKVGA